METRNDRIPRALIAEDLCGAGRCSLTAALSVLPALGVQPIPLPTAVLSTHTGGFGRPAVRDLTDYMKEAIAHYRALGLRFDAVLTGYMASCEQADVAGELLAWQESALHIVDPAMADHGRLYSGLDERLPEHMRALCERADVITPNWTEVCLLTGAEYSPSPVSPEALHSLCARLPGRAAVVTGAPLENGPANVLFENGRITLCPYEQLSAAYPGTGDLFAARLTGRLLTGSTLEAAMRDATAFLSCLIERTLQAGTPPREGVLLEGNP